MALVKPLSNTHWRLPTTIIAPLLSTAVNTHVPRDKYLRVLAEIDNSRKRCALDVEKAIKYGTESLLSEIVLVDDALRRLVDSSSTDTGLKTGIVTVHRALDGVLRRNGVERHIPKIGDSHNPETENAILPVGNSGVPGSIAVVGRTGYTLNGRTIVPAMVGVVKK